MISEDWPHPVPPIADAERAGRIRRLQQEMAKAGVDAVLLAATSNLRYFTGLVWGQSERLCGALITRRGFLYIAPAFEESRVRSLPKLEGEVAVWQEDEDPAGLVARILGPEAKLAMDDAMPLFLYFAFEDVFGVERLANAGQLTRALRLIKSPAEIALIRYAMGLTLEVHKSVHAMLKPGMRASEVVRFIDEEHRRRAGQGSSFCIVSFAEATALPHGAPYDQTLKAGDVILVDTGTRIDGYQSDLTRTYWLDEPSREDAALWRVERAAQQAVFEAAQLGAACSSLDDAARRVIDAAGMGPDYRLPGLPHRAGHGLGLDIHEEPYIVRGNGEALQAGMCFSNEPMIVAPERLGVRLEDHIYMDETGPVWFTQPSKSPTEPFG